MKMIEINWNKYRQALGVNSTCAIRNCLSGTYIHRNLSSVKLFPNRKDAQNFISKNGLNPKIYKIIAVSD
ncbi:hypothetical protein [Ruminococcus sp.]|uniref:hypothetical protein n=1 Tax=Ruminococcus sp. TaxID=41978 RepID=UPI0025D7BB5C|nr:hypothetical protein [Ruminococcus sp.]